MNRIILYGHAGSKNHGCEAIVRSSTKIIRNYNLDIPIILGTYRKNEDLNLQLEKVVDGVVNHKQVKRYSFTHIKNGVLNRLFKYQGNIKCCNSEVIANIDKSTVAMSIGGDNYCYGYPLNWMYINKASKSKEAKTILWGCSIEPYLLKSTEVVDDMKRYALITTRESITYNALIEAGVTKNTKLYPDSAFILDTVKLDLPSEFIENKTIGINISPLIQRLEKDESITYKNYHELVRYIVEHTDNNIAFIPHVVWENNNDLEPLTQLYNEFKDTGRVVLIEDHNCMELKGFISRCRMFVGARTHATIAAYSTCVPTLVVGYSVKAKGIAKDIFGAFENYVLPVQSLQNEDDLIKAFQWLCNHENKIRVHLQNFMHSYIEKAWQAGEEVKKLIEEQENSD